MYLISFTQSFPGPMRGATPQSYRMSRHHAAVASVYLKQPDNILLERRLKKGPFSRANRLRAAAFPPALTGRVSSARQLSRSTLRGAQLSVSSAPAVSLTSCLNLTVITTRSYSSLLYVCGRCLHLHVERQVKLQAGTKSTTYHLQRRDHCDGNLHVSRCQTRRPISDIAEGRRLH